MKVYDWNLTGTQTGAAGAERTQETRQADRSGGAAAGRTSAGSGHGDHVEFSSTLGRLSSALSVEDSGRAARVQELAAQYQAGAYQPNAAGAVRGLIGEAVVG